MNANGHAVLQSSLISLLVRLLCAFLLGAQVGLIVFLTPAQRWLSSGPVIILLIAVLLSLDRDPEVRKGRNSRQRQRRALRWALLVIAAPMLALAVLGALFPPAWSPAMLAIFLATSLLIAFSVGGSTGRQAIIAAMTGWLGFWIMALLAAARIDAAYQSSPGFHFNPFPAVGLAITGGLLGFAVAALGGHLGMKLRIWIWDHSQRRHGQHS
ncbi:MAG TPA: hypothetical protein VKR06_40180 [Ktedonosporobacter sp.]|nr:hypothetical protein [Ktedonosporobacter sp.]